jgi:hypothetical protein
MQPDLALAKRQVARAVVKVSAVLNGVLAEEGDARALYSLERTLRDALALLAGLEEVD